MAKLATYNRRALKSAVVAGVALGVATIGLTGFARAGDIFRPGGHGGVSHGGNFGSHNGNFGGPRGGGQNFGSAQRFGGGQHFGGGQRFGGGQHFGGVQRFGGGQGFGRVAPIYGNGYRTGHYAWTGTRHHGWRYGGYGLGAGLALGTGLAYGAPAYTYDDGYSPDYAAPDYAAPDYAYEGGDPGYAGSGYGDNIDPLQDQGDGAWDYNGTHYTCSPYEKKTRLQKRACGTS